MPVSKMRCGGRTGWTLSTAVTYTLDRQTDEIQYGRADATNWTRKYDISASDSPAARRKWKRRQPLGMISVVLEFHGVKIRPLTSVFRFCHALVKAVRELSEENEN
jgi:hypothetical protein